MRRIVETVAGIVLIVALAWAGGRVVAWAGLPVPGVILGLLAYIALLASGRMAWSLRAADLFTGLIGALIVPALVGLALFAEVLMPALGRVALVLVLSTALTALAAAACFRLAGGRG